MGFLDMARKLHCLSGIFHEYRWTNRQCQQTEARRSTRNLLSPEGFVSRHEEPVSMAIGSVQ